MNSVSSGQRWAQWVVWQVGLPIIAVLIVWAKSTTITTIKHPFHEAFATGEPVLFAALLIVGVLLETNSHQLPSQFSAHFHKNVAQAAPLVFFAGWGFIKSDMMSNDYCKLKTLPSQVQFYALGGIASALFAIAFSSFLYHVIADKMLDPGGQQQGAPKP